MAKGNRRLTTSRSERLLGAYGGGGYSNGHHAEPELREEDVWSTLHGSDDGTRFDRENVSLSEWSSRAGSESNGASTSISTRRRAPRTTEGGLSLAFDDSSDSPSSTTAARIVHQFRGQEMAGAGESPRRQVASSAPVNVPDWSKILRIDSVESLHEMSNGGDDDSDGMVPPHEYLAREYARGRKSGGASVFEGVGRTLKGRDLRRVRDAVWSQTGFDG
ncbi:unnamed protein product [Linum tenue]|uniref:Senescence regulator n=1 Tax=Linum tenue TaxID=586396 RepID=A0AAV0JCW1_9ROSI|nr:unnamed protein product [Linum tenue]